MLPSFLQNVVWVDLREGLTDDGIEKLYLGIIGVRNIIEIRRGSDIRVFDTDDRKQTSFSWYLVEPPEVKIPPRRLEEVEPWKKLHTAIERLYRTQKKLLRSMVSGKATDSTEHIKRFREHMSDNYDDYVVAYADFRRAIHEHFLQRIHDASVPEDDMVKTLAHLPICCKAMKECTYGSIRSFQSSIALAERIEHWLLEGLHFADQVLEKYFEQAKKRRK